MSQSGAGLHPAGRFPTGPLAAKQRASKSADEIGAAACKAAPLAQPSSSTSGGLSLIQTRTGRRGRRPRTRGSAPQLMLVFANGKTYGIRLQRSFALNLVHYFSSGLARRQPPWLGVSSLAVLLLGLGFGAACASAAVELSPTSRGPCRGPSSLTAARRLITGG